jgi:hypothetical protein
MDSIIRPHDLQARGLRAWHPETLDADALLDSLGRRVGEGVLLLGHLVYMGLADDARNRDTGWVPLKTEYLRKIIGQRYLDDVRHAAFEAGYVQRNPSYRAGSYSQGYAILPPYGRARLVRREITDHSLRHNLRLWRETQRREMWQRIERQDAPVAAAVCRHLWDNLQRIRIDDKIDFPEPFQPAHQVSVERIQERDYWFIVDDFGRIHTNVTNLPRALRPYLSVDGERLANIDISESQPLFMGMTIAGGAKAEAGTQQTSRQEGRRARGGRGKEESSMRGTSSHMMCSTMMCSHPLLVGKLDRRRLPRDVRSYLELCESRGLYQAVADRLGKTRDEAKKQIMVVFFDKPWHRNATSVVLDELFPTVMASMRRIKRGDYCRLAHFAQRIESEFMFGRVVPRIMERRPDLFITTIHDSILTPVGKAEFVRQVMLGEFARLGLSPQVKVEACSRTC